MDELQHHGIKGMKWGVRRFQNKNGTLTLAGKRRVSEGKPKSKGKSASKGKPAPEKQHMDYKRTHDSKSISSMSDQELRDRINRLNLERQYSQLSPKSVSRGKECIDTIITTGKTIAALTGTAYTVYENVDKIAKIPQVAKLIRKIRRRRP